MTQGGGERSESDEPSAKQVLEESKDLAPAADVAKPVAEIRQASEQVNLNIQKIVGYGALVVMVIQLSIADWVFIKYAHSKGWANLPTGAIQAWLGATVVQVVGVVLVIARSVFPQMTGARRPKARLTCAVGGPTRWARRAPASRRRRATGRFRQVRVIGGVGAG